MATVHSVNIKTVLDAKQAQADAQKLHDTISKTKKEAGSMYAGGSKALAAAYQASNPNELTQYGQTRAMRPGGTGASARDFAQQAQGLGGLVRLYATYAANVFAAAAAFNALQAAQDTANMVQGLNQLGAASGVALGKVSKDLVTVMDGAVSLREAMEATVKASQSGMVTKDIIRMGEVAKKASQALGVNMSDALSRISRGITKLEPELLDELGIFTRIDPAVQAYAKSVGKQVKELTDFERRMAFSNAVLKEGEQKFGEIQLSTNEYTKLLANLKDQATALGNSINTVLLPVVQVLNSNPTALYAVMAGLIGLILKQAIPAFSQFNENLRASQKEAQELAQNRVNQMKALIQDMRTAAEKDAGSIFEKAKRDADAKADAAVSAVESAESRLDSAISKKSTASEAAIVKEIRGMQSLAQITEDHVKRMEEHANKMTKKGSANAEQLRDLAKATREVYDSHQNYAKITEDQANTSRIAGEKVQADLEKERRFRDANNRLHNESVTLYKNETVAIAQQNVHIKGVRASILEGFKEIDNYQKNTGSDRAMNGMAKSMAKISIVTGAATSAIGGLLDKYGVWGQAAALLAVGFGVVDSFLNKSSKQVTELTEGFDSLIGVSKTLNDTVQRYANTSQINEAFSDKALQAYSNALLGVSSELETVIKKAELAKVALQTDGWGRGINSIKELFNFGIAGAEKDAIVALVKDLAVVAGTSTKSMQGFNKAVRDTFGVDNLTDAKNFEKVVSTMISNPEKRQEFINQTKQIGIAFGISSDRASSFAKKVQDSVDTYKALGDSLKISNTFIKATETTVNALNDFAKPVDDLEEKVKKMNDIFSSMDKVNFFGSNYQEAKKLAEEIENVSKEYKKLKEEEKTLLQRQADLKVEISKQDLTESRARTIIQNRDQSTDAPPTWDEQRAETFLFLLKQLKESADKIAEVRNKTRDQENKLGSGFGRAQVLSQEGARENSQALISRVLHELNKPVTALKDAVTGILGDVKGVADRVASSTIAGLKHQETSVRLETEQVMLLRKQAALLEESNAIAKLNGIQQAMAASTDPNDKIMYRGQLEKAQKEKDNASARVKSFSGSLNSVNVTALLNSKDENDRAAAQSIAGAMSAIKGLRDQQAAASLKAGYEKIREANIDERRKLKNQEDLNVAKKEQLEIDYKSGKVQEEAYISQLAEIEKESLSVKLKQQILDLDEKITQAKFAKNAPTTSAFDKEQQDTRIAQLELEKKNLAAASARNTQGIDLEKARKAQILEKERFESKSKILQMDIASKRALEDVRMVERENVKLALEGLGLDTAQLGLSLERARIEQESARNLQDIATEKARQEFELKNERITATAERAAQIDNELLAVRRNAEVQVASENLLLTANKQRLAVQKEILDVTDRQAERTQLFADFGESLVAIFDRAGAQVQVFAKGLADTIVTLEQVTAVREKNAALEAAIQNNSDKYEKEGNWEEWFKQQDELDKQKKKSKRDEMAGNIAVLNSAKKMFKEKTLGYKMLDSVEKAMHVARMWESATLLKTQLAGMVTATHAALLNSAKAAAGMVPGIFAKFLETMGPWGMAAAAAAIAAIGLGGGGGASFQTQEQLQETQGTKGVLGGEKNADINNSISLLEGLTIDGNQVAGDMLDTLRKIDFNTRGVVDELYRIPGLITGKSAFGTSEKSNPGFLGLFASSTQIIDSGIKAGVDAAGKLAFQQYETVQKTKTGFLGIGGGTKQYQNSKELPDSLQDQMKLLLKQMVDGGAKTLATMIGQKDAADSFQQKIAELIKPEQLQVSLKGLSPEDAANAIKSVFGSAISGTFEVLNPWLKNFQKFGEGLFGTAVRVNAEMKYVQAAAKFFGNKMDMYVNTLVDAPEALTDAADAAQKEVDKAKQLLEKAKTTYISQGSDGQQAINQVAVDTATKAVAAANLVLKDALTAVNEATATNIIKNIELTQKLIENAGGLEKFAEQFQFVVDNFMTEGQRSSKNFAAMSTTIAQLNKDNDQLNLSIGTTRQGYMNLISSQDLNSEAGRRNYQVLMDNAEAFDVFLEQSEKLGNQMTDKFLEAVEAGYDPTDTGKYVADSLIYSIQRSIYDETVSEIFNIFSAGIINPIIQSAKGGATASQLMQMISESSTRETLNRMKAMATNLAAVMNSAEWRALIGQLQTVTADYTTQIAYALPVINMVAPQIKRVEDASKSASNELEKLAEKLADTAGKSIDDLFKTTVDKLKQMRDELKGSISRLKEFVKSISDFRKNLLLGDRSILTPAQKYVKAKAEFDSTVARVRAGDTVAQEKLQSVQDAFLTSSREFYASGDQYAADFNSVLQAVDDSITAANNVISSEQRALNTIERHLGTLGEIDRTLMNIETILTIDSGVAAKNILRWMDSTPGRSTVTKQELIAARIIRDDSNADLILTALGAVNGVLQRTSLSTIQANGAAVSALATAGQTGARVAEVLAQIPVELSTIGNRQYYTDASRTGLMTRTDGRQDAIIDFRGGDGNYHRVTQQAVKGWLQSTEFRNKWAEGENSQRELINTIRSAGIDSNMLANIWTEFGTVGNVQETAAAFRVRAAMLGYPQFAQGINYVPYDMPAIIHEGERIFPKADNEELMKSIKGNNNTELLIEIKKLNEKVASLERTVAQGAAVNAQATERNTEAVVGAVTNSTDRTIQSNNIKERAILK